MNDNIVIAREAFSLDFCNQVRKIQPNEPATVGQNRIDADVRRSNLLFFHGCLRHYEIYKPLMDCITSLNEQHFQFDLDHLEAPQLTEYDGKYQGEYKPHVDSCPLDEFGTTRKLSFILQLSPSAEYEGGELVFPNIDAFDSVAAKEQGTVIVFPSYLLHGVKPVTEGHRKSLVAWARGPAFT
jgi:predicted 2-oxoglutarate/Fe(II)-dependent dioxygenase YbiX